MNPLQNTVDNDFHIKLCPKYNDPCKQDKCVAYNQWPDYLYITEALEITRIIIPKASGNLEYEIQEGVLNEKETTIHRICKQYNISGFETSKEHINIEFCSHGLHARALKYLGYMVSVRNPKKNNTKKYTLINQKSTTPEFHVTEEWGEG